MSAVAFAYLVRDDAKPSLASSVGSVPRHTTLGVWREAMRNHYCNRTHGPRRHATRTRSVPYTRTHTHTPSSTTPAAQERCKTPQKRVPWTGRVCHSAATELALPTPTAGRRHSFVWGSQPQQESAASIFPFLVHSYYPFCFLPPCSGVHWLFWSCWGRLRGHIVISQGGRGGLLQHHIFCLFFLSGGHGSAKAHTTKSIFNGGNDMMLTGVDRD